MRPRRGVEQRLTNLRARKADEATCKAARRALFAIETRQKHAKAAGASTKQELHAERMERKAMEARNAVRLLTLAIQQHRLDALEDGLTPEPGDRALWAVLDEVEIGLGGRMATLTEVLGSGAWTKETPP